MEKENVLAAVDQAFGSIPRPLTMLRNPNHCDECVDHERVMQSVTPETITLEEIGNIGWDPVCYITDEAYSYFMPGFARLLLHPDDPYLDQFIFHLENRSPLQIFSIKQRCAVVQLIDYLCETIYDDLVVKPLKPSYLEELEEIRDKLAQGAC